MVCLIVVCFGCITNINKKGRAVVIGYTHYWHRKPRLGKTTWSNFQADVQNLLNNADIPLTYFYKGECRKGYKATSVMINFNGWDESSHENLYIPRNRKADNYSQPDEDGHFFGFCKTAHKPYDKYVTATLLLFKHHFGKDVKIASDGSAADWEAGRLLIEDASYLGGEITQSKVAEWLDEDFEEKVELIDGVQEIVQKIVEEMTNEADKKIDPEADIKALPEDVETFKNDYDYNF